LAPNGAGGDGAVMVMVTVVVDLRYLYWVAVCECVICPPDGNSTVVITNC
jgi:hypothetical protein